MTTEEKSMRLDEICDAHLSCDGCPISDNNGKCPLAGYRKEEEKNVIDVVYNRVFHDADPTPSIKDSGERREFSTGAVRDIQEGKGRCDLMPLNVVAMVYEQNTDRSGAVNTLYSIQRFMDTGDVTYLIAALEHFLLLDNPWDGNWSTMFLEVAKHFEEGAKKYGEYNWQKGIPTHCYIDSAVRHYLKFLRGDKDEPHDRAFVWNILCCIWTCKHKPEPNDYPFVQNNKERED